MPRGRVNIIALSAHRTLRSTLYTLSHWTGSHRPKSNQPLANQRYLGLAMGDYTVQGDYHIPELLTLVSSSQREPGSLVASLNV